MSDQELIQDLKNGSEQAFITIYKKYQANLYMYAYRLIQDEESAADLVQELFAHIWERRSTISFHISLKAYLYQSVRHRFLNLEKHKKVHMVFEEYVQKQLDAHEESTSRPLHEKELNEQLDQIVKQLPVKAAKAFALRQKNYSDEEIAKELNISEKTVKNLVSLSLKKIQSKFKNVINFLFI